MIYRRLVRGIWDRKVTPAVTIESRIPRIIDSVSIRESTISLLSISWGSRMNLNNWGPPSPPNRVQDRSNYLHVCPPTTKYPLLTSLEWLSPLVLLISYRTSSPILPALRGTCARILVSPSCHHPYSWVSICLKPVISNHLGLNTHNLKKVLYVSNRKEVI